MARQRRGSTDPEALKAAFKWAAEIAEVVPPAMQEAAFHRALDQTLGDGENEQASLRGRTRTTEVDEVGGADAAKRLIEGINRTAHPQVTSASKVLD